jgi:hypothetical protein
MHKQQRSTKQETITMPRGMGSVQVRRGSYWMIYTNELGVRIQESAKTSDRAVAERLLIERAIAVLEARLVLLRSLHEATPEKTADDNSGADARRGAQLEARGESLRNDAPKRRASKSTARGGKN